MKCSVEGCNQKHCGEPEGSTKYKLCSWHWRRWGDFFAGYQDGHYGNSDRHGRLIRKLWDKAMLAFLEHCRVEISACTQIAEAVIRAGGVKELRK
jgi:hypothetical protein